MKKIKYIFKLFFFAYLIYEFTLNRTLAFENYPLLITIVAFTIFKEKYCDNIFVTVINFIIIAAGTYFYRYFGILLIIIVFDFMYEDNFVGAFVVFISEIYFLHSNENFMLIILITCISSLFAYVVNLFEKSQIMNRDALDKERQLRYEVEQFKAKLLNSSKQVANLAEVKERNRIAREIHDNVGHRITGTLIQLQAAAKVFHRDSEKSLKIISVCIKSLADTVTIIRDTVHNIKPEEKFGVEYIKNIIKNFSFCNVNFKFTGNFGQLSASKLEIIATNIKEALTNSAKHSKATEVNIEIDINEKYTRLYIKDNGIGCLKIKEGLGLSGMRERAQNLGGSISVSGENGFMIVCIIPEE